ncbi:MAG: hypothetical protein ACM3UP_00235 [Methanocella sp.]
MTPALTVLQLLPLGLAAGLQYLSIRRMGVMRYLFYVRGVWGATILAPLALNLYKLLFAAGAAACLALLWRKTPARWPRPVARALWVGAGLNLAALALLLYPPAGRLLGFPFFLLAALAGVALHYAKLAVRLARNRGTP